MSHEGIWRHNPKSCDILSLSETAPKLTNFMTKPCPRSITPWIMLLGYPLKRKCVDEIYDSGGTGSCENDNCRWSHWRKLHQNCNISTPHRTYQIDTLNTTFIHEKFEQRSVLYISLGFQPSMGWTGAHNNDVNTIFRWLLIVIIMLLLLCHVMQLLRLMIAWL